MRKSVICFDLDGTLTDPYDGLTRSFEYGLDAVGIPHGPRAELAFLIGPPLVDAVCAHFGVSRDTGEKFLLKFREFFSEYGWCDNKIYEGIPELLAKLKSRGKKILLATSKPTVFATRILKLFDIEKYFDVISGAEPEVGRERKDEVLAYALRSVGVEDGSMKEAVLIGDRKFDAEGAAKVGIDSIGVLYGYGTIEELSRAPFTCIVKSVEELNKLLSQA